MVTLEQLVDDQKLNGMTDIQVIKTFFDLNDMEEEGMELITELSKIKIEKLKHRKQMVEDWASYLPSKYLYENYDLDTADRLHTLELDYLSHGCKLSEHRLEWARENVPKIVRPQAYFIPLMEWMEEKGITFKDRQNVDFIWKNIPYIVDYHIANTIYSTQKQIKL